MSYITTVDSNLLRFAQKDKVIYERVSRSHARYVTLGLATCSTYAYASNGFKRSYWHSWVIYVPRTIRSSSPSPKRTIIQRLIKVKTKHLFTKYDADKEMLIGYRGLRFRASRSGIFPKIKEKLHDFNMKLEIEQVFAFCEVRRGA